LDTIPVGQAVLHKVVANLGSLYEAAVKLGIPPRTIRRFLEGKAPVPDTVLLRAVDVLDDPSNKP
jgi:plasmid maintenance system antidote protein VapI